jgi:hypothetical protein
MKRLVRISSFMFVGMVLSCQSQPTKPAKTTREFNSPKKEVSKQKDKGMSNPVMLSGAGGVDIGRLFNAYYRTGQLEKLISLTDKRTVEKYGREKLKVYYRKLEYGFDIDLSGLRHEGEFDILTYTCFINATKVVKQLRVVVQNDTARIVPLNPEKGIVFE